MRAPRLVTAPSPARPVPPPVPPILVLVAHGSADPRSGAVTHALAGRLRRLRPGLDVRAAFLGHSAPSLDQALSIVARERRPAVVVPLLLADGYHANVDIPAAIEASGAMVRQAGVLGEDPALVTVLGQRLAEAGMSPWDARLGVAVVAVGSSRAKANGRTATVATSLGARTRWAGIGVAFATGPHPTVSEAAARLRDEGACRVAIAPWFLAPGTLTDRVARDATGTSMVAPLGSHNLVAAVLLDRYDQVLSAPVAA